jgi:hypothetical protein
MPGAPVGKPFYDGLGRISTGEGSAAIGVDMFAAFPFAGFPQVKQAPIGS